MLEVLAQQWAALGIQATIETLDPVLQVTQYTLGSYQAAWVRLYSHHDPLYVYPFFHSRFAKGPGNLSTNFSQVEDETLDTLLVDYLTEPDLARRHELSDETVKAINAQMVDIWLFHTPYALIARNVGGPNTAREVGFSRLEPEPWMGGIWLAEPAATGGGTDDPG